MILLAGDVGGTETRLRLVSSGSASRHTLAERSFPSGRFSDLVPIVREFLAAAGEDGAAPAVDTACFGVAGPVEHDVCTVTNLAWRLDGRRLERELGISRVRLINDFEAIGHGVLTLGDGQLHTLQEGRYDRRAPRAVIGAGTGLGQAFVIPDPGGERVFATEGGHADFAPRGALERELADHLLARHGGSRVSVERVVSGLGIVAVYCFLRGRPGAVETAAMAEVSSAWRRDPEAVDLAAEVARAALAGSDPLCVEAMRIWVTAYGAESGNLALKLLPFGGLYVAGGIAAKILPLIEAGFLDAFLDKGRMRPVLERVPVHVVLEPRVGLAGAARYAARLG